MEDRCHTVGNDAHIQIIPIFDQLIRDKLAGAMHKMRIFIKCTPKPTIDHAISKTGVQQKDVTGDILRLTMERGGIGDAHFPCQTHTGLSHLERH